MARASNIVGNLRGLQIPSTGILVGAEDMDTDRNFTGTKGIETQMGRRMAIRRRHYNWKASIPTSFETSNAALRGPRVLSMIGMSDKGGGFPVTAASSPSGDQTVVGGFAGMDRITNGEFDSSIYIPAAQGVAAIGDPVFINLWYEPNGQHNNYYPGFQGAISSTLGTRGTGETRYVNAYKHVVNVFRANGASNAIFVWCMQGPSTAGWYQNLYPGDAFVDVIAIDLYRCTFRDRCTNPSTFNGGVNTQDIYLFAQGTALTSGQATSLSRTLNVVKPFMIAEAGFREGQTFTDVSGAGGDGLTYDKDGGEAGSHSAISKLLADLKVFENCIGYVHWNELGDPALSGTGNYVDTSTQSLGQYQNFYNDPYCQVFFTGQGATTVAPTHGSPTISDTTPQQGQVLSADIVPTSWDGTTPLTFGTFQWYWEDTTDINGNPVLQPISGATGQTYTVVSGDVGHRIKWAVTGTNSAGSFRAYSALTAAVIATGSTTMSTVPAAHTPGFYSSAWTTTNNHAGRVQRTVTKNGVTYVVGEFDHVVDNSGSSPVDRTNTPYFCAYRKDTGAVIQTWVPNPNDYVHDIKLNAAGTKLIVVGKFTSIGGGTRHRVAMVSVLSGPTDTTAFALNSEMPDLGSGTAQDAELWRVLLDETNSRGWLLGAQSQKITRIDLNAGAWRISSGWSPPTFTQGSGTAGPFLRCIARIGSSIYVGGQNISPSLDKLHVDTGAHQSISGAPSNTSPGLFEILTDGTVLYLGGGEDAGDMVIALDSTGSGPNSLVHGSGTDSGYWYHRCDGNVQCMALGSMNGQSVLVYGHHGDVAAATKNTTAMPDVSHGLVVLKAGTTGGDPIGYGHPPDFGRTSGTGSPLKNFCVDIDEDGDLHCGGDFTTVNSFAANVYRRYVRFTGSAAAVPVNTALPTLSNTTPSVGDTITIAGLGSWTNSPTTYITQIILRDGVGSESVVATGTASIAYTLQPTDAAKVVIADVVAVNGIGPSTHARSTASAPVGSNPTAPAPPTIDPASKPSNPSTDQAPTFFWTDTDQVAKYRWRLTTDGNVGPFTTTTGLSVQVSTPAGHAYKFEVQAGNANNLFSTSDIFSWSVTASDVPAAPVFMFTPPSSSAAKNVAFTWVNPESTTGYKWQYKLDRPTDPTPAWSLAQTYPVHDAIAPLETGSYTMHVRAINAAGTVGPESTYAFTIAAPSGVTPVVFSEFPTELDIDNNEKFTWS